QKDVAERREASATPEQRIEERSIAKAVESADALFAEGVLKGVSDLRSTLGKILGQLSERLEAEIDKYGQVKKAVDAKEKELAEIYEIQKSASTLAALIESQQHRREEFDAEMARQKEGLAREIETTRAQWEAEKSDRETESKETDAAEKKRREREREEYRYAFAREQQAARDQFTDEKAKYEREFTDRRAQSEKELAERERMVLAREEEVAGLRRRAEDFPGELQAAVAAAVAEATERAKLDAVAREEMLNREFAGERNVFTTRIAALEQTAKEQGAQLLKLSQQAEKAYAQVQDIAVKAIEGSANFKSFNSLQQLLADQGRRPSQDK
ncbi:MAG: hypothetical protein M3463_20665, partial [Verrucomicrobiota bacterium]|nr:hypothetical protein [Verrucomicrobiota bacterium]